MRGIAAALVCVLGGCVREKALLIEVQIDDHTERVELLLVRQPCPDCGTGMGLPNATMKTPGTVLYTDGDLRLDHDAIDGSNVVPFKIEPGDDDHLLSIIAVGFDDQDQPQSLLEIPGSDPGIVVSKHLGERWEVVLLPQPIGGPNKIQSTAAPGQDSYYMWRPPSSDTSELHASCMQVKRARDSSVEFIVPPIDSDCDEITDSECDRTWYHDPGVVDANTTCLATARFGACHVGHPSTCVDGIGAGCATGKYCLPDAACTACTTLDPSCIAKLINMSGPLVGSNVPRLECSIPVDTATGTPPYAPCSTTTVVSANTFAGCSSPGFVPLSGTATTTIMPVTMFTYPVKTVPTTVTVSAASAPCTFTVSVSTDLVFTDITISDVQAPAAFVLNGQQGEAMAIPLTMNFHPTSNCTNGMTCTFAPPQMTQHVWSCAE